VGVDEAPSSSGGSSSSSSSSGSAGKSYQHDLSMPRAGMSVEHPVQDGIVCDWDAYESLWGYALRNYLRADMRETPVLLSEKVRVYVWGSRRVTCAVRCVLCAVLVSNSSPPFFQPQPT